MVTQPRRWLLQRILVMVADRTDAVLDFLGALTRLSTGTLLIGDVVSFAAHYMRAMQTHIVQHMAERPCGLVHKQ
jgi:hypothetical protein